MLIGKILVVVSISCALVIGAFLGFLRGAWAIKTGKTPIWGVALDAAITVFFSAVPLWLIGSHYPEIVMREGELLPLWARLVELALATALVLVAYNATRLYAKDYFGRA